jgi:hypothetical protein
MCLITFSEYVEEQTLVVGHGQALALSHLAWTVTWHGQAQARGLWTGTPSWLNQ